MSAAAERRRRRLIPSTARPASLRAARRAGADYGAPGEPNWRQTAFTQTSVPVQGRAVNVVTLGDEAGPPIVFVHGLGGSWKNWLENMPAAARHRRVMALDLPGFGESELPDGEISISNYARCVEAVLTALDLEAVELVGNSMGGFVSAELAITQPARVHTLTLVDAAGISITDLMRVPTMTMMRLIAAQSSWGAGQEAMLARPRLRHLAFRAVMRHPTRLSLDLVAHQAGGPGMPGFVLAMDALLSYDFRDRLPEIACPTLIIHGADDMLVPVADAYEFERLIPTSRLEILEDTGHVAMLERPRTFNAMLAEFLGREAPGWPTNQA
jgi:pimeloyl-ACP methyl ester carboxylesterase